MVKKGALVTTRVCVPIMAEPVNGLPYGIQPLTDRSGITDGERNDLGAPMQMQCKETHKCKQNKISRVQVKFSKSPAESLETIDRPENSALHATRARIRFVLGYYSSDSMSRVSIEILCSLYDALSSVHAKQINGCTHAKHKDDYAVQSFERGIAAQDSGAFAWEIVPVEVSGGRGKPSTIVDKDEGLGKLRKLRPSFKETGGSVTAGNASSISDGAAALVLVSGEMALKLGLHVIGKIAGYADAAQAPELFTTAPALAIPKAISNAGLEASQVDYYEINEAFAVVSLSNMKLLGLNPEKVNVHGGAVSLGHPLGCSGARILVTLLGVLKQKNGKYGVGSVCNGGGGASALVVELL
ncbi:hypothetical protein HYC85_007583 [Camellia sinensis]|uniref:Thiolase C-terminal domain-containing protein n=1 Tax=Camellia sinensis TaxID=4442 RepID=A0A7J7HQP6_CAMSI|nr:hypothetical protein HYC85_007583 [Camellia sinensis]